MKNKITPLTEKIRESWFRRSQTNKARIHDVKETLKNLKKELKKKFYQRGYSEGGLAFKIIDKAFKKHLGDIK